MIFQIGVAPCRVDIISKISGVSYTEAVTRAVPKTIDGIPVATRLVSDLWSVAHDGAPFPTMDRTVYNYITEVKV